MSPPPPLSPLYIGVGPGGVTECLTTRSRESGHLDPVTAWHSVCLKVSQPCYRCGSCGIPPGPGPSDGDVTTRSRAVQLSSRGFVLCPFDRSVPGLLNPRRGTLWAIFSKYDRHRQPRHGTGWPIETLDTRVLQLPHVLSAMREGVRADTDLGPAGSTVLVVDRRPGSTRGNRTLGPQAL